MFAKDRLLVKLQFYISQENLLFPFGFSSGIIELDLSYLGDFLGIMCASLKDLDLLIDIRAVHPTSLVPTSCSFAHLSQQSPQRPVLVKLFLVHEIAQVGGSWRQLDVADHPGRLLPDQGIHIGVSGPVARVIQHPHFRVETATMLGVWRWMMALMSGLAWWMAECSMKPAWFTPKLVVPSSTVSPCMLTFTRLEAITSLYIIPNGFSRKCSVSWLTLAVTWL